MKAFFSHTHHRAFTVWRLTWNTKAQFITTYGSESYTKNTWQKIMSELLSIIQRWFIRVWILLKCVIESTEWETACIILMRIIVVILSILNVFKATRTVDVMHSINNNQAMRKNKTFTGPLIHDRNTPEENHCHTI